MDMLPQGAGPVGCWTSLDVGVPLAPRAGEKTTSALTKDVKARRNMEAVKDLESILITNKWKSVGWQQDQQEIDCKERVFLERETEVVMNVGRDHGWAFIHERKRHSDNVRRTGQRNFLQRKSRLPTSSSDWLL
jgi:hypothetical protein